MNDDDNNTKNINNKEWEEEDISGSRSVSINHQIKETVSKANNHIKEQ